mmetsp:Transcript_18708/g.33850  ORF Transcript_18708/g.33850 Transcript_18708/m.33850 type:complete len:121 (+) Transcript_18708:388-750(+)
MALCLTSLDLNVEYDLRKFQLKNMSNHLSPPQPFHQYHLTSLRLQLARMQKYSYNGIYQASSVGYFGLMVVVHFEESAVPNTGERKLSIMVVVVEAAEKDAATDVPNTEEVKRCGSCLCS